MKRYASLFFMIGLILFIAFGCGKDEVTPANSLQNDVAANNAEKEIVLEEKAAAKIETKQEKTKNDEERSEKGDSPDKVNDKNEHPEKEDAESEGDSSTPAKTETPATNSEQEEATNRQNNSEKSETTKQPKQPEEQSQPNEQRDKKKEQKKQKNQEKQKETPKQKPQEPSSYVTIAIDARDVKGQIVSQTNVELKEGDTVLDVTRRIVKQRGIQISVRGAGAGAYVEGIDNLYEFDEGQNSGWMIRLDGQLIKQSAGATPISEGQTIYWFYTTNYLKESGAGG